VPEAQDEKMATGRLARYRLYLRQRPVMLALLSLAAVIFFVIVSGLSRAYHDQREALGDRWFHRGVADLNAKRFDAAVTEFRTALLYSRDNYDYQLNLAEALIGQKHTGQASAYLLNLWEREPENGLVNLELARIATQKGQTEQAVRYYHNAVYAAWSGDQESIRREARFELIQFLLGANARAQAQSELIALAENVGDDPIQQERIGQLFLRAQDYEHALAAFRLVLNSDRHNQAALAGAGEATFQLGQYPEARNYMHTAVSANPNDTRSMEGLETTEMVLRMDPFRRQLSAAERDRIVVEAFATAGQRLESCTAAKNGAASAAAQASLNHEWTTMKPRVTIPGLRRDRDLVESAMDLVFRIERQTSVACGTPTGTDLALLLIAKLHEGN
jgi:tetratricopeptide (TPR) repeat protein